MGASQNDHTSLKDLEKFKFAMALSARPTIFGPVLFAGRIEEGFSALQKSGFHYVELSLRNADDLPAKDLSELLQKYELKVTALATGQGCIHDGLCLSSTDPQIHKAAVERLFKITDLAATLKADVIIGGVRGRLSGSEQEQVSQKENIIDGVRQCCTYAAQLGITILLEAINRYETNFINTAAEGMNFINEVGRPNLKILLDTFHMNIEEVDLPTAIHMTGKSLGYIHFVDSNRLSPGQGHINLVSVLKALEEIDYQGVISAEILPLPDDHSAVQRTANYLESLGVKMGTV